MSLKKLRSLTEHLLEKECPGYQSSRLLRISSDIEKVIHLIENSSVDEAKEILISLRKEFFHNNEQIK